MNVAPKSPDDKASSSASRQDSVAAEHATGGTCCDIDIRIDSRGDVNIYNCSTPGAAGAIAIVVLAYDIITALWAPADPIIRDSFALSASDLEVLTNANSPIPDPRTFKSEEGIVVNVNKTVIPIKLPLEYHETREYVSDDEDSRYEITYRFNRIA